MGIQTKLFLIIIVGGLLVSVFINRYIIKITDNQVTELSLQSAQNISKQIRTMRGYYTRNVVKTALANDLTASHDFKDRPEAIPLPATMVHDLNKEISQKQGYTIRLFSEYPYPWRKDGNAKDPFEKQAIQALKEDADQVFWARTEKDGVQMLRYATADRMVAQTCVNCHNTHPDTPKKDWKIGDIRGVLEINIPLEQSARTAFASAWKASLLISGATLIILLCTGYFLKHRLFKPLAEITDTANRLANGDINHTSDYTASDEIGQLAASFRNIIAAQHNKVRAAAAIANGDLAIEIQAVSERDTLGKAMMTMKSNLTTMRNDLQSTIRRLKAGDMDARCDHEKVKGTYSALLAEVNASLDAVIHPLSEGIELLQAYARGDLTRQMRPLPGKQAVFTESLNTVRKNLYALISEVMLLTQSTAEGRLNARGNVEKFEGGYQEVVAGINKMIENILKPIDETVNCLETLAEGDLTVSINGDYRGDHGIIKTAFNKTVGSLNHLLSQTGATLTQVTSRSNGVLKLSDQLSEGTVKQASAIEEISSSINEISQQTQLNAQNSLEANRLAVNAKTSADQGNQRMQQTLSAIKDINKSSAGISQIIKTIDEIAFQTNLLALNAAVEAARAGVHGKGFAIVAEEVRNLAQRSARSAQETNELIERSLQNVNNGTHLAKITAESLEEIVKEISKVTNLASEIATASNDQSRALDQINQGLTQIDQVIMSNTQNSEDCASDSEVLAKQAILLAEKLNRFKLKTASASFSHAPEMVL